MEYSVGLLLALGVGVLGSTVGFDRTRSYYPVILIVVASYYDLFAVLGGSPSALTNELLISATFILAAVIGFRTNLWLVVAALAAHGLMDLVHHRLVANPGVPAWWPMFCMAFDIAAAGYLAIRLLPPGRHVEAELRRADAAEKAGDAAMAFHHLERAHVLGQHSTIAHVTVHLQMLRFALRQRDCAGAAGQVLRVLGAATMTAIGLVPQGNTGGSNVSAFKAMPVPEDLAALMADRPRRPLRAVLAAALATGVVFGAGGCSAAATDGRIAQVDGHAVAYRVLGNGKPVLVLISGLGEGMASFDGVAARLAETATVIVYDRAGYGGSEAVSGPRDAVAVDRELSGVLRAAGVVGPYVVGGHSTGGLYAEYFAARHPEAVTGLILVDARPADFTERCAAAKLSMCVATPAMMVFSPKGAQAEVAALPETMAQVAAAGPVSGKSVLVLSRAISAKAKPMDVLWAQAQADLAGRYPGSRHLRAPGGGHAVHRDQQEWFVETVEHFLSSTR